MSQQVTIIGGGLAGCEAAWQLATRGCPVCLVDRKPQTRSPAAASDKLAELVCSNSLRSSNPLNAVGLLKCEMERLGSLIIQCAVATRVPAGDALAVQREAFAAMVTERIEAHPLVTRCCAEIRELPPSDTTIIATGPLTADSLAQSILRHTGQTGLYFYDAIAPIVASTSIDRSQVFAASRYDKGGDDYLNCPFDRPQYEAFYQALRAAETVPLHAFETPKFFAGCQPIEVIAATGVDALRFGPMKPVGLNDPRTGRRPFAVVQLRQEDQDGQAFNLVGFQTKMTVPAQRAVLSLIPGLPHAEFLRYGAVHRNTYINSPALLDDRMRLRSMPHIYFAGQIAGVEGYVESAGHGLITGLAVAAAVVGVPFTPPPETTPLGALWSHVTGKVRTPRHGFEPQNVNWSLCPAPPPEIKRSATKPYRQHRAEQDFVAWAASVGITLVPSTLALSFRPAMD